MCGAWQLKLGRYWLQCKGGARPGTAHITRDGVTNERRSKSEKRRSIRNCYIQVKRGTIASSKPAYSSSCTLTQLSAIVPVPLERREEVAADSSSESAIEDVSDSPVEGPVEAAALAVVDIAASSASVGIRRSSLADRTGEMGGGGIVVEDAETEGGTSSRAARNEAFRCSRRRGSKRRKSSIAVGSFEARLYVLAVPQRQKSSSVQGL